MKRISHVHLGNLGKSFSIVLGFLTMAWVTASILVWGDIYVSPPIFILNLILTVVLGWFFYKQRYHVLFFYDEEGFEMRRGKEVVKDLWRNFALLSLVHLGGGEFALRLYRDDEKGTFLDIPVSALKLDPWQFRSEVQQFIRKPQPHNAS